MNVDYVDYISPLAVYYYTIVGYINLSCVDLVHLV